MLLRAPPGNNLQQSPGTALKSPPATDVILVGSTQSFQGHFTLALVEGCKHELEISIPAEAVDQETARVTEQYRQKAHLKGFRAGKAPASLIRQNFAGDILQKVLENLVPKYFEAKVKEEQLHPVGTPDISDVHFHE